MAEPESSQRKLVPTLGLFSATMLIAGSAIGSGIFLLPATMAALVQDPVLLVLVWVVGGLITVCGALTFAELASMFPRAGGQYVFLRESLGKAWGFLFGWTSFWVIQSGIIAAVAYAFARFSRTLFGFEAPWVPLVAVACIASLTVVNYFGVRFGGMVQNIFTVAKVGAILALVVLGFAMANPPHPLFDQPAVDAPVGLALFIAFFLAMQQAFFALDGWPQAAYVASEIKQPTRTIPRAMLIGVGLVVVVYVLASLVYLHLLPLSQIVGRIADPGSGLNIASEAARVFAGDTGARLIAAAIMVSTFGTVNAYILTSPRIYYAVARDGTFWEPFRKVSDKHRTPHMAIWYQGIWASFLVVLGSLAADAYTAIVGAVVFGIWLFYVPGAVGYFRLRLQKPDLPRPYRTTLYPAVPIVFLAAALVVVINALVSDVIVLATQPFSLSLLAARSGLWGTFFVLAGVPFLIEWRMAQRRGEPNPLSSPVAED